jgi:hypothetical protein
MTAGRKWDDPAMERQRLRRGDEARTGPAPVVLHGDQLVVRDRRPSPWRPHPVIAVAVVLAGIAFLLNVTPAVLIAYVVVTMLGLQTTVAVDRGRVLAEDLARTPGVENLACAVADALQDCGLSPRGSEAVRAVLDVHGQRHCVLEGVGPEVAATFATALDEVGSPMVAPRYVVPRWVLRGPVDNGHGLRAAFGRLRPDGGVWHSVPTVLCTSGRRAQAFAVAWDRWVGGGPALCTGSAEGLVVLASHRGSDPFDLTTVRRDR